jgi:hypothetical protein
MLDPSQPSRSESQDGIEPYEPYHLLHWGRSLRLGSPSIKLVLQILCERADQFGVCFPGQDSLAVESEQKPRAVREQLAILERLGIITRQHRYDLRGKRTSDNMVLQARTIMPLSDFTELVRTTRRKRALRASRAGSSNTPETPTTGAQEHDYRRQDAPTTGAPAPGKYQREATEVTTRDHLGNATTDGAQGPVGNADSSTGFTTGAASPAARSDAIRFRALGASRGRRGLARHPAVLAPAAVATGGGATRDRTHADASP